MDKLDEIISILVKKLKEEIADGIKREDKILICKDCGKEFVFTVQKQELFKDKQFPMPKRCCNCRIVKRERFNKK